MDIAWPLYLAAAIVVIVVPGQDLVLVISRGLGQGTTAGMATAAGVAVGLTLHTGLTAAGIGALLMASALLFTVVKAIGVAYLAYLGLRLLLGRSDLFEPAPIGAGNLRTAFVQGLFSNLSNPKIVLFFAAFLPQFVDPGTAQPVLAMILLGLVFAAITFVYTALVGYGAGRLSAWLKRRPRVVRTIRRSSGAVLLLIGARLAMAERG